LCLFLLLKTIELFLHITKPDWRKRVMFFRLGKLENCNEIRSASSGSQNIPLEAKIKMIIFSPMYIRNRIVDEINFFSKKIDFYFSRKSFWVESLTRISFIYQSITRRIKFQKNIVDQFWMKNARKLDLSIKTEYQIFNWKSV
jgi:hypothetical protein